MTTSDNNAMTSTLYNEINFLAPSIKGNNDLRLNILESLSLKLGEYFNIEELEPNRSALIQNVIQFDEEICFMNYNFRNIGLSLVDNSVGLSIKDNFENYQYFVNQGWKIIKLGGGDIKKCSYLLEEKINNIELLNNFFGLNYYNFKLIVQKEKFRLAV